MRFGTGVLWHFGAGGSVTIRPSAAGGAALDANAVPEPSVVALLLAGVAGLAAVAWRRKR